MPAAPSLPPEFSMFSKSPNENLPISLISSTVGYYSTLQTKKKKKRLKRETSRFTFNPSTHQSQEITMSMTESDFAHATREYKFFRQVSRDRLLYEMLRNAKPKDGKASWKVLIMDKCAVKVMAYSCKMADITDEGVSLVEDLFKRRQPMPAMDAIYYIQPSKENVIMFLSDMSGRCPLYKKAYVFFSSPIPKELVTHIKMDTSVIPRIGALGEMNLEYFAIDSQGFVTDHEMALVDLYGENAEKSPKYNACLSTMAIRIATVFASLKEFPNVRYRAAKSSPDASSVAIQHDLVPTKLAAEVWNCISKYKTSIPDYPQNETCELLIVDRTIDQIAPVIHEWTYDAMCHDLLNMDGNKYVHEISSRSGLPPEKKEVLLEDSDHVWLELRHAHIADASERLSDKMENFASKNKLKAIHTYTPIKNPSSFSDTRSFTRRRRSNRCFCNSDETESDSSSSPEGDKRKQELLARMAMLQTQKVRLTDFLDERSTYLTQFAEDANAEFDEIGEKAMKELDEAGDRIMEKLESRMQAFEESADMSREEIEKNEKVLEEFEDQIEEDRNEGLFFKNLREKAPQAKPEAKVEAQKLREITKENARSKVRRNIYLALMTLLAVTIATAILATTEVEWGKVAALMFIFLGLLAQFIYERSLSMKSEEKDD